MCFILTQVGVTLLADLIPWPSKPCDVVTCSVPAQRPRWRLPPAAAGENCRPTMDFRLSHHAEWEMTRRGIPLVLVQVVMDHPEQRLVDESRAGRWIHQSRLQFEDGKMYLLRVVVNEGEQPPVIITAYRTSKIEKYWST